MWPALCGDLSPLSIFCLFEAKRGKNEKAAINRRTPKALSSNILPRQQSSHHAERDGYFKTFSFFACRTLRCRDNLKSVVFHSSVTGKTAVPDAVSRKTVTDRHLSQGMQHGGEDSIGGSNRPCLGVGSLATRHQRPLGPQVGRPSLSTSGLRPQPGRTGPGREARLAGHARPAASAASRGGELVPFFHKRARSLPDATTPASCAAGGCTASSAAGIRCARR